MAVSLREFFLPIERPVPERRPSPYPEPRRPAGIRPPATEAEAAAAAVKVLFGPINWIDEQRAIDKRARPWKQLSLGRFLGQDLSGEDYTLDLRGNWRTFLTHPTKTVKKAAKSLVIRKAYDSTQSAFLRRELDLWKAGKITTQEYNKFVSRVGKALDWIGPRDWEKVFDPLSGTWKEVSTSLTKGAGRLWEWMDFIDNPIGYTMREYVWKKGVRPGISKVTSPITKPVRKGASKVKTVVKTKVTDPIKARIKQVVGQAWVWVKSKVKKVVKKVITKKAAQAVSKAAKTAAKKIGQAVAPVVKKALVAAGQALIKVGTQIVVFVGQAVTSVAAAAASAVSASTIAIIVVVVIVLLIILALITTIGTHSAFLPPEFGPPLPGEQFVQLRKLIYHETTAGSGVNPLKIPLGARPDVNFEIIYRNVSEGMLTDIRIVDNYDESALTILDSGGGIVESTGGDERLVWDIGDLDVDQAGTVFYSTMLNSTASDQVVFNNVTLTAAVEGQEDVNVSAQGVVIVGNPAGQPPSGWPVNHGCISQGFNVTSDPAASHYGKNVIDIAGVTNQAIYATHDGIVYYGRNSRAGRYVGIVSEESGFSTFYCHLETINPNLENNTHIPVGQLLGGMGADGNTDGGVHLHYEVKKDGTLVTSQYIPGNSFDGCVDRITILGGTCDCCFTSREARCGQ